jgi:hypothetical protein
MKQPWQPTYKRHNPTRLLALVQPGTNHIASTWHNVQNTAGKRDRAADGTEPSIIGQEMNGDQRKASDLVHQLDRPILDRRLDLQLLLGKRSVHSDVRFRESPHPDPLCVHQMPAGRRLQAYQSRRMAVASGASGSRLASRISKLKGRC